MFFFIIKIIAPPEIVPCRGCVYKHLYKDYKQPDPEQWNQPATVDRLATAPKCRQNNQLF